MFEGGCLCGAITYKINGKPIVVAHCSCRDCQKVSGAGHSTGAMFPVEQISVAGEMAEYKSLAESGNMVSHLFCPTCSSRLFGKNTGMPGVMTVAVGTLNDSDMFEPQVAIFARSRRHWDLADTRVQSFDAQPAWRPEDGV